jgi:carboxypeptidase family protein
MKRVLGGLVGGWIAAAMTSALALAQAGSTAQITGTVKDASGGVLPGVEVTATQTATGLKRTTISDAAGAYTLPNLPVGPYRLDANLPGFKSYSRTGLVLQVNDNPVIDVELSLGAVEESVQVQAAAPLVETRNIGIGQVIENKRILELPLNGRNPVDLVGLVGAAVQPDGAGGLSTSRSMQGGKFISVAGGQAAGVGYLLDGATHNNPYDNANLPLPFPDALDQFKVETSALSAQNGMHSGAAVNAVTKSGTNVAHGDAFEFLRNHSLNATSPFAAKNPDGSRKDDGLNRNQYGGVLGGPIRKDKLFFFAGYQGTNTRQTPADNIAFVPTAQMLAGDWMAFAAPACNGGRSLSLRAPFAGNTISPALYSKPALAILGHLPATTDPCGRITYPSRVEIDEGQSVGKLDYQWNIHHSIFGRYMATSFRQPPPFSLIDNVLTTTVGGRDNLAQSFTLGDNYILSTSAVNAFRFAFNRTAIHRTSKDFFSAPDVGVNTFSYMPHYMLLTVTGGFSLGGGTESESTFRTNTYQFGDDITIIKGAHQMAFGGSAAYWKSTSLANVRDPGMFSFDSSATGAGLADFLVGRPNQFIQAGPNNLFMTEWYAGLYAQDTWHVNGNMTMNYGLRWEPYFPQQITNGAIYLFSLDAFKAGQRTTVYKNAPPGFSYPGDPGFPNGFAGMNKRWTDVAPRIGVAWDPQGDGRMSIRSSYGVGYDFVNAQYHLNTAIAPPWGSDVRIQNPVGGFESPFLGYPGGNPFPLPFDSNSGAFAPADARFSSAAQYLAIDPNIHPTTVQSYNVAFQRQLGRDHLVTATYLGTYTTHLWNMKALNYGLTSITSAILNGNPTTCVPGAANFGTCMNSILQQRRVLTQIDPASGALIGNLDAHDDSGWERYNGVIVSFQRVGSAVGYSVNYTLSKCIGLPSAAGQLPNVGTGWSDPNNPEFDKGPCDVDRRHVANITASYRTPARSGGTLAALGSDWRISGLLRAQSGAPLNITTGQDRALNGIVTPQRVNQVLDNGYGDTSSLTNYLNPAAFAQPAFGTLGTYVRNSLYGPSRWQIDMVLARLVRFGGAQNVELRVEAFNVTNNFIRATPVTNLSSPTFGQILAAGDPRILQFGLKYAF